MDRPPAPLPGAAEHETHRVPRARHASILIVAGLDPSGGAGLLADAGVVREHGLHPAGVVTALTEQDSTQCSFTHPVAAEVVGSQLARLVDDLAIHAVKVGVVGSEETVRAVALALGRLAQERVPIVFDPVLRATRGVPLFQGLGAPAELLRPLFHLAVLVTPNLEELALLSGVAVHDRASMRVAAERLRGLGARAVLAKGGHLPGDPIDLLVDDEGTIGYAAARIPLEGERTVHGTGCALSTELACRLALGAPLREAVFGARERIRQRISETRAVGRGRPFLG
jgi:hydroxymethylpyrimidine/phosphomethylpyrimidine kinase